jgi:ATP-binding cassette, subfamily B, bacterial
MQRLIVRLIDSQNPEALQAALRWLYSFVRPHRLAIAGLCT